MWVLVGPCKNPWQCSEIACWEAKRPADKVGFRHCGAVTCTSNQSSVCSMKHCMQCVAVDAADRGVDVFSGSPVRGKRSGIRKSLACFATFGCVSRTLSLMCLEAVGTYPPFLLHRVSCITALLGPCRKREALQLVCKQLCRRLTFIIGCQSPQSIAILPLSSQAPNMHLVI